jgi:ABC-type transport system involved in cytochrome c biogenesis permease subunit
MDGALELGWGAQVVACGAYGYDLFSRKGGGARAARALLAAAWALVGVALASRWQAAGLTRPPWLGLGETMVFGAWMLTGVELLAELRYGARLAGFFAAALAAAVVGTVIFKLGGMGPSLPPHSAWQRPWVWLHVPFGAAGYSFCLLAAFLSLARLVRGGVGAQAFQLAWVALSMVSLAPLAIARAPGGWGLEPTADPLLLVMLAGHAAWIALALAGYWLESLDRRLLAEREANAGPESKDAKDAKNAKGAKNPRSAAQLLSPRRGQWRWLRWLFAICWASLATRLVLATRLAPGSGRGAWLDGVRQPYLFAWLWFLAAAGVAAFPLASSRRKAIEERLPEPETIDGWSHQASLVAFPLLTVSWVAGSLWAYDAWASYWSWGAQQAWAVAAWLYLGWLLHLKQGRKSTAMAALALLVWVAAAVGSGAPGAAGARQGFWPVGIH